MSTEPAATSPTPAAQSAVPSDAPVVSAPCGPVRGVWRDVVVHDGAPAPAFTRSAAFLGIPYAEAPVGPLRLAAPRRRAPWTQVRDATAYGPTPQRGAEDSTTTIPEPSVPGEDTLSVNVFTPVPGQADAGLPVMVWVHGGGFVSGSAASPWYDGAAFNRDGVVTVSVSYRLGFLGFGWVADSDAPVNRGMLDIVTALTWVRDNIADFGGDPGRVTLAGQSAGGGAVMALLASPLTDGLVHGAVCHSGAVPDTDLARAEATGRRVAEAAGVDPTMAGWAPLDEETIVAAQAAAGLRIGTGELVATLTEAYGPEGPMRLPFGPVVDGSFLTATVGEALAHGVGGTLPLLIGATSHEFTAAGPMFAGELAERGTTVRDALLEAGRSDEQVDAFLAAHRELAGDEAALVGQVLTDTAFHAPFLAWVRARTARNSRTVAETWLFRHAQPGASGLATHCLDLPFVFDCLEAKRVRVAEGPQPSQELADEMHADWVRFIRTGNPGWEARTAAGEGKVYAVPSRLGDAFVYATSLLAPPAPTPD